MSPPGHQLLVYGAGCSGREVAWLAGECEPPFHVVGFIDDAASDDAGFVAQIPVLRFDTALERHPEALVSLAIGDPRIRERLAARVERAGRQFATLIHRGVHRSRRVSVGEGSVVCAGCILTVDVQLGRLVHVNLGCTISHDARLGDFTTLSPGVHVSGWVHMGRRVYVGTGAVFINGREAAPLVIDDDAVVGAGACVTRNVAASTTVVGVPAKPLRK